MVHGRSFLNWRFMHWLISGKDSHLANALMIR